MLTPEQNKRLIKWAAVLRSGEYTQCTSRLRCQEEDNSGKWSSYCCLGVACDAGIVSTHPLDKEWQLDECSGLSEYQLEELALTHEEQNYFMRLNDLKGFTFAQIADEIDEMRIRKNATQDTSSTQELDDKTDPAQ